MRISGVEDIVLSACPSVKERETGAVCVVEEMGVAAGGMTRSLSL